MLASSTPATASLARRRRRALLRTVARHQVALYLAHAARSAERDPSVQATLDATSAAVAALDAASPTDSSPPPPTSAAARFPPLFKHLGALTGSVRATAGDFLTDYLLWASVLNILASGGYVFANYSRGYLDGHASFTDVLYVSLALAFLADSLLYLWSWEGSIPNPRRSALMGEYLNIAGSAGYVISSVLYLFESPSNPVILSTVLFLEAGLVLVFLADALVYLYAWYSVVPPNLRGRGCTPRDPEAWGNALNIVPSVLYLVGTVVGLWLNLTQVREVDGVTGGETDNALRTMARINVWGDLLWLIDAVIYFIAWARDYAEEVAPSPSPPEDVGGDVPLLPAFASRGVLAVLGGGTPAALQREASEWGWGGERRQPLHVPARARGETDLLEASITRSSFAELALDGLDIAELEGDGYNVCSPCNTALADAAACCGRGWVFVGLGESELALGTRRRRAGVDRRDDGLQTGWRELRGSDDSADLLE